MIGENNNPNGFFIRAYNGADKISVENAVRLFWQETERMLQKRLTSCQENLHEYAKYGVADDLLSEVADRWRQDVLTKVRRYYDRNFVGLNLCDSISIERYRESVDYVRHLVESDKSVVAIIHKYQSQILAERLTQCEQGSHLELDVDQCASVSKIINKFITDYAVLHHAKNVGGLGLLNDFIDDYLGLFARANVLFIDEYDRLIFEVGQHGFGWFGGQDNTNLVAAEKNVAEYFVWYNCVIDDLPQIGKQDLTNVWKQYYRVFVDIQDCYADYSSLILGRKYKWLLPPAALVATESDFSLEEAKPHDEFSYLLCMFALRIVDRTYVDHFLSFGKQLVESTPGLTAQLFHQYYQSQMQLDLEKIYRHISNQAQYLSKVGSGSYNSVVRGIIAAIVNDVSFNVGNLPAFYARCRDEMQHKIAVSELEQQPSLSM